MRMRWLAKNYFTDKALCTGALFWCRIHQSFFQKSDLYFRTRSLSLIGTFSYYFWLTVSHNRSAFSYYFWLTVFQNRSALVSVLVLRHFWRWGSFSVHKLPICFRVILENTRLAFLAHVLSCFIHHVKFIPFHFVIVPHNIINFLNFCFCSDSHRSTGSTIILHLKIFFLNHKGNCLHYFERFQNLSTVVINILIFKRMCSGSFSFLTYIVTLRRKSIRIADENTNKEELKNKRFDRKQCDGWFP